MGFGGFECLNYLKSYKINLKIYLGVMKMSNSKAAVIGAILGATFGVGFFAIEIITILLRLL